MTSAALVEKWAGQVRRATARRNWAIEKMHDDGASLREIADAAGLSHTAVAKILRRSRGEQ